MNKIKAPKKTISLFEAIFKNNPLLVFGITSFIGCIILNIGIFKDYAFTDSYEFIWEADISPIFQDIFISGGRPLYGLISQWAFGPLSDTISDLKWIRFFSLIGSVIFSIQLFKFLLKLKLKPYESALFSFLIFSLPSFSIFIGWSSTFQIPWSLNLSFLAGLILQKTLEDNKFNLLKYLSAVLLVIISLCLYQSAGTAFLIPFVFATVISNEIDIRKLKQLFVFLCISFALYFIVFKLNIYWQGIEALNRSKLNPIKFPFRFILFYVREMKTLLQGSGILVWNTLFLILGFVSFAGFFILKKEKNRLLLLFLFFIIPISYLPNLISADSWRSSRTVAPAALIVLFYQFYFLRQLSLDKKIIKILSLNLGLILLVISFINLNIYIVGIQQREYNALKSVFEKVPLNNTKDIIFIIPNSDFLVKNGFYKQQYSDEFIQVSSARWWVPSPLLNQIQKEKRKVLHLEKNAKPNYKIEVYKYGESYKNPNNSMVININDILIKEFSK